MLSVNVAIVDQSELPFPKQLQLLGEQEELVVELEEEECELPLPIPLPGAGWLIIS